MTDRDVAFAEIFHDIGGKNVVHKSGILETSENAVVIYNYSAGLLTAVLKCKQTVICGADNITLFAE